MLLRRMKLRADFSLCHFGSFTEVSQSAADLHGQCLVKNKDIRKFLDGIYCSGKSTVVQDEA